MCFPPDYSFFFYAQTVSKYRLNMHSKRQMSEDSLMQACRILVRLALLLQ